MMSDFTEGGIVPQGKQPASLILPGETLINADWLKDMQILKVQPGDLVILRYDGILSYEDTAYIKSRLEGDLPDGVKVVILEEGMDIGVIRQGVNDE